MIARLTLLFLSTGCAHGTSLKDDTSRLSATEGIILSGGMFTETSVEVFDPTTGHYCFLPALPDDRYAHTMDHLLICGGDLFSAIAPTTCLAFTSGQWTTSHTLAEKRGYHTSWQTEQGLVLMGGSNSYNTSEIVATAGGQEGPSFDMQYKTLLACSMQDLTSDSVIITGGATLTTVSRYDVLGWVEDLPSLVVGRMHHGCGAYLREDGSQVLLVAGGLDESTWNYLRSTEVLTEDSPGWTLASPLKWAVFGPRGVTAAGRLYMTGGGNGVNNDEILVWRDDEQKWEEIGKMKMARSFHAVSTIQMDDQAMEHCG